MQLADETDALPVEHDLRGTARMQGRVNRPLKLGNPRKEQRLKVCLQIEEIDTAAGLSPLLRAGETTRQRSQADGLVKTVYGLTRRATVKTAPDLEDTHPAGLTLAVGGQVGDQAADQRRAHHAHLAGNRVGQTHRIGVAGEVLLPGLFDEGEVDDLLELATRHQTPHEHGVTPGFRTRQHADRPPGRKHRDIVVAMKTGDFLDEVFLDLQVEPVGRRRDDEVLTIPDHIEIEAHEHLGDGIGAQGNPQHAAHAGRTQADRSAGRQFARLHGLHHRAGLAAANVEDQAGGTLDGLGGQGKVHPALEAVGGVRGETMGTGAPGNRIGCEEGVFQEQISRVEGDPAVFTAHHARQRQGAGFVSNQQGIGGRGHGLAVEEQNLLAGSRKADVDGPVQLRLVEGVERLAEFEHDVVGDIHQSTD